MSDSKPFWLKIAEAAGAALLGALTKKNLETAGAGPDAMAGAATGALDLPTFSDPIAAEEELQRGRIVAFMRMQLGKSYELGVEVQNGHEDEASSWDCSEAVEHAYERAGLMIPDGAQQQYDACQAVHHPEAGDLGFLWSDKRGKIGHVLVCSERGSIIHAVGGRGVVEDPIAMWTMHPRWRGWRRHVDFARPKEDRA